MFKIAFKNDLFKFILDVDLFKNDLSLFVMVFM